MSDTDDWENPKSSALVRTETPDSLALADPGSALEQSRTARGMLDALMRGAGGFISERTGLNCMFIPLNYLDAQTEVPDAMEELRPIFDKLFGESNVVTYSNGLNGYVSINIPIIYLEKLTEEECRELLVAIAPVVQLSMRKGQELQEMKSLVGPKFKVGRMTMREDREHCAVRGVDVFEISQKTYRNANDSGTIIDPLNTDDAGDYLPNDEAVARRTKAYWHDLTRLDQVLNHAIGEADFFKGCWADNGFVILNVKEADFDRLMNHPNIDKVRAIFDDPIQHCQEFRGAHTLRGRIKGILGAGPRKALPASSHAPQAIADKVDETPAQSNGEQETWESAARKAFGPGGENATGSGFGI